MVTIIINLFRAKSKLQKWNYDMADNSSNSAWLGLGLGVGIIVGGFFTFLILREREQPVQQAVQTMQPTFDMNVFQQMTAEAQRMSAEIQRLTQENATLKAQLLYQSQPREVKTQIPETLKAPAIETYKNSEKWVLEYGKDGEIKSLDIIRDAKLNGGTAS